MIGRFLGAESAPTTPEPAGRRMLEWGVGAGVVLGLVVVGTRTVLPDLFTDDAAVAAPGRHPAGLGRRCSNR